MNFFSYQVSFWIEDLQHRVRLHLHLVKYLHMVSIRKSGRRDEKKGKKGKKKGGRGRERGGGEKKEVKDNGYFNLRIKQFDG